ncbi:MAG TPA: hypothetical protein PKU78_06160 [Candidatus Dojkabacteria bacterium]|nr:hypothetical protein [Candidatus Dojkabacteria bacterium]HRO65780.1 hypothetical protein [Candidatus Dojkabacteria bacterium]HRP50835.1 hypothetical protein [Candidatus Dojkabacteria bacterium]
MNNNPEVKEEVVREPSEEQPIRRSMIPLYTNLFLVFVLLAFLLLVFVFLMMFLSDYLESIALPLNMIVITLLVGFYLVYFVLSYLNYRSVSYMLIPGSIQKTTLNTIDQIPGKILVKEGFFYRNKLLLTMNDFDHIRIEKSFVGRAYNFGHIYLMQIDELVSTKNYVLTNVYEPEEAATLIQKMIDVEIFKSTPARSNTSDEKSDGKSK